MRYAFRYPFGQINCTLNTSQSAEAPLLDRSSQTQSNGHAHFIGLAGLSLSDTLRSQVDALGHVQWVGNIYEVAAEQAQHRHRYRALLVDLRALARPDVDALLALSRRTGLPVWLLPVDAGRTRLAAALAGGALPWPQNSAKPRNGHATPPAYEIPATKVVPANGASGRPHPGPAPVASPASVAPAAPLPVAPLPEPQLPPATRPSPLQGLPARLFEPAPAKSENVNPANIQSKEVTSPPLPQYDEMSPVLSEEELRALLGPAE